MARSAGAKHPALPDHGTGQCRRWQQLGVGAFVSLPVPSVFAVPLLPPCLSQLSIYYCVPVLVGWGLGFPCHLRPLVTSPPC